MKSRIAQMVAGAVSLPMLTEVAARVALRHWGGYYRYIPNTRRHIALDRAALPAFRPVTRIEINCNGERGGQPPHEDERALRALVTGASGAECVFLDQDQTWSAVVERILSEPHNLRALGVSRVHVGNVAHASLTCAQVDASLQKMLPRYHELDVILIMVGASDVLSWMEQGLPRSLSEDTSDPAKLFEQHPEGPWAWTLEKSALRRIARGLYRDFRRPIVERSGGGEWLHRARKMRADAEQMIDEEPDATPMLDHFAHHLTALLRTAQSGATRVILVRQPWLNPDASTEKQRWNFGIGRPYREKVTAYFSSRVVQALMRRVDARATAVADRMGVQHVDLLPHLERSARTFYDCTHFTPEGAEAVGRLVADAIVHPVLRVVRPRVITASERG